MPDSSPLHSPVVTIPPVPGRTGHFTASNLHAIRAQRSFRPYFTTASKVPVSTVLSCFICTKIR